MYEVLKSIHLKTKDKILIEDIRNMNFHYFAIQTGGPEGMIQSIVIYYETESQFKELITIITRRAELNGTK